MRAPEFWAREGGALPRLLAPGAALWRAAGGLRRALTREYRAPVPVLCIGNLVAGGAGKTPLARTVAARLRAAGREVHFLSRGHGGAARGPLRVEPGRHRAAEVGDEPLLLAADGPCWVARDRPAGARAAVAAGAEIIVMDDGFQNPSLAKDLSLIAIDGGYGFGNGRVMPAGPLREPVEEGLARASAAVLVGPDRFALADRLAARLPVLCARLVPDEAARALKGRTVISFAGIGRPAKFEDTLAEIGCNVVGRWRFADHHAYTPDEVMELCEIAQARGALAVTTAKDAVRLPPEARRMVTVVEVGLIFERPEAAAALLRPYLQRE